MKRKTKAKLIALSSLALFGVIASMAVNMKTDTNVVQTKAEATMLCGGSFVDSLPCDQRWVGSDEDFYSGNGYKFDANETLTSPTFAAQKSVQIKLMFGHNGGATSTFKVEALDSTNSVLASTDNIVPTEAYNNQKTLIDAGTLTSSSTNIVKVRINFTKVKNYGMKQFEVWTVDSGETKKLNSITVSGTPTKTTYTEGESFDPAGLTVTGYYDNSTESEITNGIDWTITPSTMSLGTTSVTVKAKVGEIESESYVVTGLTVKEVPKKPTDLVELTLKNGSQITDSSVKIGSETLPAKKFGKSGAGGTATVVVPNTAEKLIVYAAAWNGKTVSLSIPNTYADTYKKTITSDSGLANSPSVFELTNGEGLWDNCYRYEYELKGLSSTENTITLTSSERIFVWYVGYKLKDLSIPTSLSVTFKDNKTEYYQGDKIGEFTATASFDKGADRDVTADVNTEAFSTSTVGTGLTADLTYTYNDVTVKYTYTYNVQEDPLSYIYVDETNSKINGTVGSNYPTDGVVIMGHYENGGNKVVTGATITLDPAAPTKRKETVTITASYPNVSNATGTVTATAKYNGTKDYPFNPSEAIEFFDKTSDNTNVYYVEGIVTSISGNNIFIKDDVEEDQDPKEFEFYGVGYEEGVKIGNGVVVGDFAVASGKLKKYYSTYEFDYGCKICEYFTPSKVPTKITIESKTYEYFEGDEFVMPTVTATLADGVTTAVVTDDCEVSGFASTTVTDSATATISYTYGRVTVTCDYIYKVEPDTLNSVEVNITATDEFAASEISGYCGPKELDGVETGYFDFSKVVVIGHYASGDKDISSLATINCSNEIINPGKYSVTITATYNSVTSDPVTFNDVEVVNGGKSVNAPLSISQAIALYDDGDRNTYYVKGYAATDATWDSTNGSVTLTDSTEKTLSLDKFVYDGALVEPEIKATNEVISCGQLSKSNSDYELAEGNIVKSINDASYTITSIEMVTEPKLNYYLGEKFTTEGMKIVGSTSIGVDVDITSDVEIDMGGFNSLKDPLVYDGFVDYTITFTYPGFDPITKTATVSAKDSYADGGFNLVTAEKEDWTGTYVLAYDNKVAWTGVDEGNCVTSISPTDGSFSEIPNDAVKLQIEKMDGGYSIKVIGGTNNGYYVGNNGTKNGISFNENKLVNTITYENNEVVIKGAGGCTLRFNNNSGDSNYRFRYYASNQQPIQLFEERLQRQVVQIKGVLKDSIDEDTLTNRTKLTVDDFDVFVRYDNGHWDDTPVTGATLKDTEVTLVTGENELEFHYNGVTGYGHVTAREFITATSVTIDQGDTAQLFDTETLQLSATVAPTGDLGTRADDQSVTWSSNNPDVASVDEDGLVTAHEVANDGNTVIITATTNDGTSLTDTITLTVDHDDVVSFTVISQPEHSYTDGDEFLFDGFDLTIQPVYESGREVDPVTYIGNEDDFSFSRETVNSTVSSNSTNVVVTYLGASTTIWVDVFPYVTSVTVNSVTGVSNLFSDHDENLDGEAIATVNMTIVYSNGKHESVTRNVKITDFTAGSHTCELTEGGKTVSFTYSVTQATVSYLELVETGTNVYFKGEKFSLDNYVIAAVYNSGHKVILNNEDITVEKGNKALDSTVDHVTITYSGQSLDLTVTVEDETNVQSISVEKDTFNVYLNEKFEFEGDIYGVYATGQRVITDELVKTINSTVDTSKVGTTVYTFTWNNASFSITVTVNYAPVESVEIVNFPSSAYQYIGEEFDLKVSILPSNAKQEATFSSSNTNVATIDENGHLEIVGEGSAIITVTSGGKKMTYRIYGIVHVESVELTEDEITLGTMEGYNSYSLYYDIFPTTAYNQDVTFEVFDYASGVSSKGLSIDEYGTITALRAGVYRVDVVTADGGFRDSIKVTVLGVQDLTSLTVSDYTNEITLGDTYSFDGTIVAHYEICDVDVTEQFVSLINNAINSRGAGNQTVTVYYGGKTIVITVNVKYAATTSVDMVSEANDAYYVGDELDLAFTVSPINADQGVAWSTSNPAVAVVDQNGHVIIVGVGDAVITVTQGSFSDTFEIHVGKHVESVTFDQFNYTITTNEEAQLLYTVNPGDAEDTSVTFICDDENVHISSTGLVSCEVEGVYEITIITNDGNYVSYATVKVIPEETQKTGCEGSIVGTSILVTTIALAGAGLLTSKKRKEDK